MEEKKKNTWDINTLWTFFSNRKFNGNFFWRYLRTKLSSNGFTLIELLIVIVVIGVLAVGIITLLNPLAQIQRARDAQRKNDLSQIQIALEGYSIDNNRYPDLYALFGGADPWGQEWLPYVAKVPKDPLSPKQYYYYQLADDASWYRLYAKLEHCPDAQMIPGTDCTNFNYAVSSSNIAVVSLPTPVPIPTSTPGPAIKYVFVTSKAYSGNLKSAGGGVDGLDGAKKVCEFLAESSPLFNPNLKNRTWKAWLSTSSVNAVDRIYPPGTEATIYKRLDGAVVANNKDDLLDGINNPINITEYYLQITSNVWTGTNNNGTAFGPNCKDWMDNDSNGQIGLTSPSASWTSSGTDNCLSLTTTRLYCFEQ